MIEEVSNVIEKLRSQGVEESLLEPLENLVSDYQTVLSLLHDFQSRAYNSGYFNDIEEW